MSCKSNGVLVACLLAWVCTSCQDKAAPPEATHKTHESVAAQDGSDGTANPTPNGAEGGTSGEATDASRDVQVDPRPTKVAASRPQPELTVRTAGAPIEIKGAIAFDTGALVHVVLSTRPLACPGEDATDLSPVVDGEHRMDLEVVDRFLANGKTQWSVHDRSSTKGLGDEGLDPPVTAVERADGRVEVQLPSTQIKNRQREIYDLEGTVDALLCKGPHPRFRIPGIAPRPTTLTMSVQSAEYPVVGATIEEVAGRIKLDLGTGPLGCDQVEGQNDVILSLIHLSLDRDAGGVSLRGDRIRGFHNSTPKGLHVGVETADDGTAVVTVTGQAIVVDYLLGFNGGQVRAIDCRK